MDVFVCRADFLRFMTSSAISLLVLDLDVDVGCGMCMCIWDDYLRWNTYSKMIDWEEVYGMRAGSGRFEEEEVVIVGCFVGDFVRDRRRLTGGVGDEG